MQHPRNPPIPPYGSPEYITGSSPRENVNRGGYDQQNTGYTMPTGTEGGSQLSAQPVERGLPPPNLSIQGQPGPPRPPSAYPDISALPYLREEPQPPVPPVPSSGRPQSSPFPRFVPPPPMPFMLQSSSAPNTPGSMYPPVVDYHSQALAVVGGHPGVTPRRAEPVFYPAMMRPHDPVPGRASMPVEAVMARYGQALPDEPAPGAPIFPRAEGHPVPSRKENSRKRLSRPHHGRRTLSDQQPLQTPPPPPPPQTQQPVVEEKKRPGSMVRKLTKRRPTSAPTDSKGKVDPSMKFPGLDSSQRMEILPDTLFHVRATQDYEMQSYDEISFSKGSIIAVTSAPESGRWMGFVVDSLGPKKQEGIFYRTFVSLLERVDSSKARGNVLFLVEAVYSYRATREDEFDFSAGDTISVYSTPQGPFWIGVNERSLSTARAKLFPWKLVAPK